MEPIIFDYEDLIHPSKDLSYLIEKAFGKDSLGLCLVKNLPNYLPLRSRLLTLASSFAHLPEAEKEKCVHEASQYSFGWSHGKERMNGKLDTSKDPIYNQPPNAKNMDFQKKYPHYGHDNIWPKDALPELEGAFMELGQYIVNVGKLVAKHCDKYIEQQKSIDPSLSKIPANFFHTAIEDSQTHKARLLHYFPMDCVPKVSESMDSWCGLHVDHSLLTGLTSAMFLDETNLDTNDSFQKTVYKELDKSTPEMRDLLSDAGLFVQARNDEFVRVAIPTDCLAFQLGEAAQIASRYWLRATPHLVRGVPKLARNTFAVFMQPNVDYPLTEELNFSQFTEQVMKRHY